MLIRSLSLIAAILCGVYSQANADIIDLDFGRTGNAAGGNYNAIGTAVNTGNVIDGSTFALVENLTGAATGIVLEINPDGATAGEPTSGSHAGSGANYDGPYPTAVAGESLAALQDSLFVSGGSSSATTGARVEFELTGLDPLSTYDIELYGGRGNASGTAVFFVSDDGGVTYGAGQSQSVGNNSTTVSTFTGLSGSSSISVIFTTTGAQGAVNYGRITENAIAVPEPTSVALLTFAGIGCLVRRRR